MNPETVFIKSFQQEFIKQAQMKNNLKIFIPVRIGMGILRSLMKAKKDKKLKAAAHGAIRGAGGGLAMGAGHWIGKHIGELIGDSDDYKFAGGISGMLLGSLLGSYALDKVLASIYGKEKIKELYEYI